MVLKAGAGDRFGGMGSSSWTGVWQVCTGGTVASPCLLAGLSVNVTVDDEESSFHLHCPTAPGTGGS